MLSKKAKYGLKAVIHLAKHYKQGSILITDLALKEKMPKKFLEAILLELKNKGILYSKKGQGGGYSLGRAPEEIMIGEIMRVLDGPLALVQCVSETAYARCQECKSEELCEIRMLMKEVRNAMSNILDKTSLADILEKVQSGKEILSFVI